MELNTIAPRRGRRGEPDDRALAFVETLVAAALRVPAGQIRAPRRCAAPIARARQVAMYLAYTRLGLPFRDVGRRFGRDRTTVSHACRAVEDRREDGRFDRVMDGLERAVDLWLEIEASEA
jgi:chromosomal replication initiation ATPase DnaA